jgi:hypothetical protein
MFVGVDLGVVEFAAVVFLPAYEISIYCRQQERHVVIETNGAAFDGLNRSRAALVHPCSFPNLN